jgi:hypothetical protein
MVIDGSNPVVWGKPLEYRNDVILMTGKFVTILKVLLYGEFLDK